MGLDRCSMLKWEPSCVGAMGCVMSESADWTNWRFGRHRCTYLFASQQATIHSGRTTGILSCSAFL